MANDISFYYKTNELIEIDENMLAKANKFLKTGKVDLDDPDLHIKMMEFAGDNKFAWDGFEKAKIYHTNGTIEIETKDYRGAFEDNKLMAFLLSLVIKKGSISLLFHIGFDNWGYNIYPNKVEELVFKPITTNITKF